MSIDDRFDGLGRDLPEFGKDFGGFFDRVHGVNYDHSIRPLDHNTVGDPIADSHVDVVADLFHPFLEDFAVLYQ